VESFFGFAADLTDGADYHRFFLWLLEVGCDGLVTRVAN